MKPISIAGRTISLKKQGDCLVAEASVSKEHVPYIVVLGRRTSLQKVQWERANPSTPLPAKTVVKATCSTPHCINPAHLKPMTHSEIVRLRGRSGEKNGRSKLTVEQVAIIKNSPKFPVDELAQHFGVSTGAISDIRRGINWAQIVPDENTPKYQRPAETQLKLDQIESEKNQKRLLKVIHRGVDPETLEYVGFHADAKFLKKLGEVTPCDNPSTYVDLEDLRELQEPGKIAYLIRNEICKIIHNLRIDTYELRLPKIPILGHPDNWVGFLENLSPDRDEACKQWDDWCKENPSGKLKAVISRVRTTVAKSIQQLETRQDELKQKLGEKTIAEFRIHYRTANCLDRSRIFHLWELANLTPTQLRGRTGIQAESILTILADAAEIGTLLRMEPTPFELAFCNELDWVKRERNLVTNIAWLSAYAEECEIGKADPSWETEIVRKAYQLKSSDFPKESRHHTWLLRRE